MGLAGCRNDGQPVEIRGLTVFQIRDDQIVAGRLNMENLEREHIGITQVVEGLSGRQPGLEQQ